MPVGGLVGGVAVMMKTGHGLWQPGRARQRLPACPAAAGVCDCLRAHRLQLSTGAQLLSSALYCDVSAGPALQQHLHHHIMQLFPAFTIF